MKTKTDSQRASWPCPCAVLGTVCSLCGVARIDQYGRKHWVRVNTQGSPLLFWAHWDRECSAGADEDHTAECNERSAHRLTHPHV